jgi:hypothetical protein
MISASIADTILRPLFARPGAGSPGGHLQAQECARPVIGTAVTRRASCGRVK